MFTKMMPECELSLFEDSFIEKGGVCLTAECLRKRSTCTGVHRPPVFLAASVNKKLSSQYSSDSTAYLLSKRVTK